MSGLDGAAAVALAGFDTVEIAARLARDTGLAALPGEPLAPHTTMRVGGPADLLVVAATTEALLGAVRLGRAAGISVSVIGRGSDLLVSDAGIRGLVVLCRTERARFNGERLTADAGLPLARAATLAARAGLSGLEFGLAIPGSVGGAVWANAGAHGSEIAAVLESVRIFRTDGTEEEVPASALRLAYRDSALKHAAPAAAPTAEPAEAGRSAAAPSQPSAPAPRDPHRGDLVLSAVFALQPDAPAAIEARLDEIRQWRREHQPLTRPSAGSVFRNPPGDSAGRLIDACGLKGERIGGAVISPKHANFIVNAGGATASDVRHLAEKARLAVSRRFDIELEYEVQFAGDWSGWQQEVA